jgi:hypothetical protein
MAILQTSLGTSIAPIDSGAHLSHLVFFHAYYDTSSSCQIYRLDCLWLAAAVARSSTDSATCGHILVLSTLQRARSVRLDVSHPRENFRLKSVPFNYYFFGQEMQNDGELEEKAARHIQFTCQLMYTPFGKEGAVAGLIRSVCTARSRRPLSAEEHLPRNSGEQIREI